MRQQTLAAQTGFEKYGRKTKRERFLEEMEQIVPWAELQGLVEPHYLKGENGCLFSLRSHYLSDAPHGSRFDDSLEGHESARDLTAARQQWSQHMMKPFLLLQLMLVAGSGCGNC